MSMIVDPYKLVGGGIDATALSPNWRHSNIDLSAGNLTVAKLSSTTAYNLAGSVDAKVSGKWYFEAYLDDVDASGNLAIGVANYLHRLDTNLDSSARATSYMAYGPVRHNNISVGTSLGAASSGDRIGVLLDLDSGEVGFRRNGGAFTTVTTLPSGPLFPIVQIYNAADQVTLNFGGSSFVDAIPSGASPWERNASYSGDYWRYTQYAGVNGANCAELELRTEAAGADQTAGATMTASSTFSTLVAANTIDNNSSTIWGANSSAGGVHWLQAQLTSAMAIVEATYLIRGDFNQYGSEISFTYSNDGTNFYPAKWADSQTFSLGEQKTFNWD